MGSVATHTSVECVDDADGVPGVIVYENQMYPLPSQEAGAGQGLHSHKKKDESKSGKVKGEPGSSVLPVSGRHISQPTVETTPDTSQ